MTSVLVINAGSSSIKYQLFDVTAQARVTSGMIDRIGQAQGTVTHRGHGHSLNWSAEFPDHAAGFACMAEAFAKAGSPLEGLGVAAVGHRVVQGGSRFVEPTLVDDRVAEEILGLAELAPLHAPGNHQAIVAARAAFPDIPHVAVFDTAFHQSMPPAAYTYAIDREVAQRHGVRRYGFHGISHDVVSRRAAEFLGRPVDQLRQVILHLGNGASACAVDHGRSIATSMGMTPLEGLVMGTRSGDIDPGALLHLMRAGLDADALDALLNKGSGLLGLAGSNDMRDVRTAATQGDAVARSALDVYVRRVRHYLGAYLLELGGADTVVFTAGVGENSAELRAEVCAGLEWFGIEIDPVRNAMPTSDLVLADARVISTERSRVTVLVVPTDEEAEIARQTWARVTADG